MFVDEVKIRVKAGDGGDGSTAFHREKFVQFGGPSGGDGGDGGDVVLVAGRSASLRAYRNCSVFKAKSGDPGHPKSCHGRAGEDIVLEVPLGTQVLDLATGERLADLTEEGARVVAAKGGRGGRGNKHFATPTLQTPRFAEPGEKGKARELLLDLKLIADVGLVGLPNAGKSTLLSRISAARPKIADYPFTTLAPYLGVVDYADSGSLVVADIPGLIEGAHQGLGLGDRFLRHVERTRVLLLVVDLAPIDGSDPLAAVRVVEGELAGYGAGLADKPRLVAGNKLDLPGAREAADRLSEALGERIVAFSGVTGEGLPELLLALRRRASRAKGDDDA